MCRAEPDMLLNPVIVHLNNIGRPLIGEQLTRIHAKQGPNRMVKGDSVKAFVGDFCNPVVQIKVFWSASGAWIAL